MLTRITVTLTTQERDALRALAEKELRDTRAQAALIIREELQRRGLLEAAPVPIPPEVKPQGMQDAA